ncbi:MAG: hypothetical protein R3A51_11505 [Nannocystaceae bacterium]
MLDPTYTYMSASTIERRNQRSSIPWEAAGFLLRHVARESGLGDMVLATDEGLLIAAAEDRRQAERVAALGPLAARGPEAVDPALAFKITGGRPIQTYPVQVRGRRFHVVGLGRPTALRRDVQAALDRIFARRSDLQN